MTDGREPVGSSEQEEPTGPVIRDKRRIDPETGDVRADDTADEGSSGMTSDQPDLNAADTGETVEKTAAPDEAVAPEAPTASTGPQPGDPDYVHPDTLLAAERLADLQRLQAEYVNYKRRVDRDRDKERDATTARLVESLMPVMDDIHLARQHGDLVGGPFEKIAEKLQLILERHGFEQFGAEGEPFDPTQHEALMHIQAPVPEGATGTTVVQVMQPGYRVGERVVRPARVAVADPDEGGDS